MPETHAVPVEDGETVVAVHHERETRPAGASRSGERRPEGAVSSEGRNEVSPSEREGSETRPEGPSRGGEQRPVESREPGRASHSSADWIVFCHGFLSDKSGSYERRCERVAAAGYDAVRFDFRGSGESDRAFVDATLSTRIADLRAVLEYFDPGSVALFGSSFGAKVALHCAVCEGRSEASPSTDDRVAAVVGRAPVTFNRAFEEYRDLVAEAGTLRIDDGHAIDGRFFEDFDRYGFEDVAADLEIPVALFHGTDDDSVPLADSLDAVAALESDVLLQTYHGEGHRYSAAAEERLLRQTLDWLATV